MQPLAFQAFAIVPAAGRSRRMGRPKLLLPWRDGTVIDRVLDAWCGSRVAQIMVVTHPDDELLHSRCHRPNVTVLSASPPPVDMKASIARGLDRIARTFNPQQGDAWLVAPADLPLLSAAVIDALLAAHDPCNPAILRPALADGRLGHPVLFPWSLAAEVASLPAESGVNELLLRHGAKTVACPFAPATEDMDTPEEFERLREKEMRNEG